jgi:hypothetical protein
MASNQVPNKREQLFVAAQQLVDGLKAQEARLGIKQNTEEVIRSALAAALNANTAFKVLTATNASLNAALKDAVANATSFVQAAKFVLMKSLGKRWSAAWFLTGFPEGSLLVPKDEAGQQALLELLQKYLEANPDKQVEGLSVTASQTGAILEALKNAKAAVGASNSSLMTAKELRKQKEQELRWRFSGLVGELGLLLEDEDPTWYAFGLSRPSDPKTPAAPNDVSLTAGLPGTIFVSWEAAPRADRYKIYKKEEGDAEFRPAATTVDPELLITGLKGGSPIEIQVSAINVAGESLPSIPAQIVVPPESPATVQG